MRGLLTSYALVFIEYNNGLFSYKDSPDVGMPISIDVDDVTEEWGLYFSKIIRSNETLTAIGHYFGYKYALDIHLRFPFFWQTL